MSLLRTFLRSITLRRFALIGLAGGVLGVVALTVVGPRYLVAVQFQPRAASRSGLGGLAAQLGVDASSNLDSPQFYAELVRVPDLLAIVSRATVFTSSGAKVTVSEALESTDADSARQVAKTVRKLRVIVTVAADRRTGIVTFSVTDPDKDVAFGIASNLLSALSEFDSERRRTRAGVERRFVDARVTELSAAVRAAEDSLRIFLTENQQLGSPSLALDRDRLARAVSLKQGVLISLAQSLEQAKIEEVRDTPMISVIEEPKRPVFPVRQRRSVWALVGAFLALLVFVLWSVRGDLRAKIQTFLRSALD